MLTPRLRTGLAGRCLGFPGWVSSPCRDPASGLSRGTFLILVVLVCRPRRVTSIDLPSLLLSRERLPSGSAQLQAGQTWWGGGQAQRRRRFPPPVTCPGCSEAGSRLPVLFQSSIVLTLWAVVCSTTKPFSCETLRKPIVGTKGQVATEGPFSLNILFLTPQKNSSPKVFKL